MTSTSIQKAAADEYAVMDDGDMKEIVDAGLSQEVTYDMLVGSENGNTMAAYIYGEAQSAQSLKELAHMLRNGATELVSLANRLERRES